MFTNRKQWTEAREHCSSLGRRLLEIRTPNDLYRASQVYTEINSGGTTVGLWLGGHRSNFGDEFKWISNGDPINVNDNFWFVSNNAYSNCVALYQRLRYSAFCSTRMGYACE